MATSWEDLILFSFLNKIKRKKNMKKFIYKITNMVNGKIYIGQTTDWKRRFSEHKARGYGQESNKILYLAFDKYGIENFNFEVIEECENYNEREKYWIKYYNCILPNGYNMTEGGEEPPLNKKENSPFATHTQADVDKVVDLLLNTKMIYKDIARVTNYDVSTIKRINSGKLWYDDKYNYPLRKEHSKNFVEERAKNIINDLLNTKMTQKEIAAKYGVARSTVTAINSGQNNHDPELNYPLRGKKQNYDYTPNVLMIDSETLKVLKEFRSAKEAGVFLGNPNKRTTILQCLKGETKLAYGYFWKYKE
jgi:group I intron endonuclease